MEIACIGSRCFPLKKRMNIIMKLVWCLHHRVKKSGYGTEGLVYYIQNKIIQLFDSEYYNENIIFVTTSYRTSSKRKFSSKI